MSRQILVEVRCDLCGYEVIRNVDYELATDGWQRVSAVIDVCPDCAAGETS